MINLSQANAELKTLRSRCRVEQVGNKLVLRGTFPPKDGAICRDWVRERIFIGANATPAGLQYAREMALKISNEIDRGLFDRVDYSRKTPEGDSAEEIIAAFKLHKRSQGISNRTWEDDYVEVFRKIPSRQELTSEYLIQLIQTTKPNTRTRRRYCIALGAIAKFAEIDVDLTQYSGNYSPSKVQPRDIPTDEAIATYQEKFKSKPWQWAYGILATYGIRPGELLALNCDDLPILNITGGKTGDRRVWPIYPEWFEAFDLGKVSVPKITDPDQTSRRFLDYKLPFRPYDLRHAWAIRSMEFGLPIELAAAQMGHSMAIHSKTYHRWISDRHHQRAYDTAMERISNQRKPILR